MISSEDVFRKKTLSRIILEMHDGMNSLPSTTVIFEDSHIGREGAKKSEANLIPVVD